MRGIALGLVVAVLGGGCGKKKAKPAAPDDPGGGGRLISVGGQKVGKSSAEERAEAERLAGAGSPAATTAPAAPAPTLALAPAIEPAGPRFQPETPPARRYEPPVAVNQPDEYEQFGLNVVAAAAQRAGKPAPVLDHRLSLAAAAATRLTTRPSTSMWDFLLEHHGVSDETPAIMGAGTSGKLSGVRAMLIDQVANALGKNDHERFGAGGHVDKDGMRNIRFILVPSDVTLDPLPRVVAAGAKVTVSGRLHPPFVDGRLAVTGTDGQVTRIEPTRPAPDRFTAEVSCPPQPGAIQVEVLARDESGPSVASIITIFCGSEPPTSHPIGERITGGFKDMADVEQQIFARLNQDRVAAGLPALTWSDEAATAARAHSADMRDHDFFAHISPTHGDLVARAKTVMTFSALAENLGSGESPGEVHEGLMGSPGHRANVLATQVTQVGVGAVLKGKLLLVTEIFRAP